MSIFLFIELLIVVFTVILWVFAIMELKSIPKGLIEWLLLIASVGIIVSWILGYVPE